MRKLIVGSLAVAVCVAFATLVHSHCEVPCGIYDDAARLVLLEEHIATIEKAMGQITEISKADDVNYNQLVRWTTTKEAHAEKIQHIVTQYFMTQRVKPAERSDGAKYRKYVKELTLLHGMLVAAMKSKQTTDTGHTANLKSLVKDFRQSYLGPAK